MHSGLLLDADRRRPGCAGTGRTEREPGHARRRAPDGRQSRARGRSRAARDAISSSRRARSSTRRGDPTWSRRRKPIGLTARLTAERDPERARPLLVAAAEVVGRLRAHGWEAGADELMLVRVRSGVRLGVIDEIRADVDLAPRRERSTAGARPRSPVGTRRRSVGRSMTDGSGALDACRAGLDILDDIVAEAMTLEQRSAAMRLGHDLSQFAIELADRPWRRRHGARRRRGHESTGTPRRTPRARAPSHADARPAPTVARRAVGATRGPHPDRVDRRRATRCGRW